MALMKCGSCGGTYETVQPGGYLYFHACPPIFDLSTGEYVERPDKRDENVRLATFDSDGNELDEVNAERARVDGRNLARRSVMKAAGKGAARVER